MDDWSLLPSRNAVSEPAPYHQSPLNPTLNPAARLDPPRQAPTAGAANPCPLAERLTRQTEPGNAAMKSRGRAPKPFTYRTITTMNTPTKQPNGTNLQPPLDTNVPFMDDIGAFASAELLPRIPGLLPAPPGCASRRRGRGAVVRVAMWLVVPGAAPVPGWISERVLGIGAAHGNVRRRSTVSCAGRRPAPASLQAVAAGSYARPGYPPIAKSRTPSGPGRILRRAVGPTRMTWSASSLYRWPSTCTSAEPRSAM